MKFLRASVIAIAFSPIVFVVKTRKPVHETVAAFLRQVFAERKAFSKI